MQFIDNFYNFPIDCFAWVTYSQFITENVRYVCLANQRHTVESTFVFLLIVQKVLYCPFSHLTVRSPSTILVIMFE